MFTGINFQDYATLCDSLSDQLRERFSEYLFFISEKNSQNIKTLANSIFTQWDSNSNIKSHKRSNFSFKNLFEEIKEKSNEKKNNTNLIIFVFKQFELIPKDTIEQFISLVSCYVEKIPIYFLIELGSQANVIYEQLSSEVVAKLCIKRLYLMSPELYLDKFLSKLFIDQTTLFKLSGDILKYLVDTYYDYNFSISSFIHALKFCYYDHLQQDPFNQIYLTHQIDEFELSSSLSNQFTIPSELNLNLLNYQENWIKQNNQFAFMCQLLYEIVKSFPCENNDEHSLFSASSTRSFSDFYVRIWSLCSNSIKALSNKQFTEMSQYSSLKNLLQIASSNTINDIVCVFLDLINDKLMQNQADYFTDFLNDIHDFEEILNKQKQAFSVQINEISFNEEDELNDDKFEQNQEQKPPAPLLTSQLGRRKSTRTSRVLGELPTFLIEQQQITHPVIIKSQVSKHKPAAQMAANKKLNNNAINALKQNMIDWLDNQFKLNFNKDYSTQLEHSKYFCYSDFEKVQRRLFDMQRINVHNCLFNTGDYLKLKTNEQMNDSPNKRKKNQLIDDTIICNDELQVPLSIVYKLYLECGHMINLYDWLQAFVDRMENSDLKDLNDSKRKLMQALFFRSITELQFMGFIKPTNRKVDHVVKLTNGSSLLAIEDHCYQLKINYH